MDVHLDCTKPMQLTAYELAIRAQDLQRTRPAQWQEQLLEVTRLLDMHRASAPVFKYISSGSNANLGPIIMPVKPGDAVWPWLTPYTPSTKPSEADL